MEYHYVNHLSPGWQLSCRVKLTGRALRFSVACYQAIGGSAGGDEWPNAIARLRGILSGRALGLPSSPKEETKADTPSSHNILGGPPGFEHLYN